MTNRLSYSIYWAQDGVAKDPDTDTSHPSYVANRYANIGWKAEKPPEEWQNYLLQITDQKIISHLSSGMPYYDASVSYAIGSVHPNNNQFWLMQDTKSTLVLAPDASSYTNFMASLNKTITDHIANDNAHNDTVDTLTDKTYLKATVDKMFGDDTDPTNITYHIKQTGAVHSETPEQLGTLSASSGGSFTGDVIFTSGLKLSSGSLDKGLKYDSDNGLVRFWRNSASVGIDDSGHAYYYTVGNSWQLFVTEGNFDDIQIEVNNLFSLPYPFISINIESGLSDLFGVGLWTITTNAEPKFSNGFVIPSDDDVALTGVVASSGIAATSSHTIHLRGWSSTGSSIAITDVDGRKTYSTLKEILSAANSSGWTSIKQIVIYPKLTDYQKASLVQ